MVKRLIFVSLLAAGGTGAYVFGPDAIAPNSDPGNTASATADGQAPDEWQVEYVDGEGKPIQRETGLRAAAGRFKLVSKPFFKRISGESADSSVRVGGADCTNGTSNVSLKRTSGG